MLVWLGIDINSQLLEVRKSVEEVNHELNFNSLSLSLPLHISLKMSFEIEESFFNNIVEDVSAYYLSLKPFYIKLRGIQKYDNIIWIRMENNNELDNLHSTLVALLQNKYNITPHEYDLDFRFHSTLVMDDDKETISQAYDRIKDIPIPKEVVADTFAIGYSNTGELGSYYIYKEFVISKT